MVRIEISSGKFLTGGMLENFGFNRDYPIGFRVVKALLHYLTWWSSSFGPEAIHSCTGYCIRASVHKWEPKFGVRAANSLSFLTTLLLSLVDGMHAQQVT